ncbi:hypothetical protein ANN_00351 [Periplaneta americana]|uniref:Uncharacterized protein n=1 Tax=Periplaneta americana TaxID=6978 RepID=A0ABQ8TQK2_PERAM|nr:hypothetical protein ANN_00351 [Periplaneta americana]
MGSGKTPEKYQPVKLSQPGFDPGPASFAVRQADHYSRAANPFKRFTLRNISLSLNNSVPNISAENINKNDERWRTLHNAELHALYSSPDIIRNIKSRRLRWEGM